jgi:HAMP domain-containing protein
VATASGVPWLAQAALLLFAVVGLVLCAPFGGLLAQLRSGITQTEEVSVLRGVALAESLANRNAQPLADQRGLALETTFLMEKDGVRDAVIADRTGTVLAPPDKLRTSVALQPAWLETSKTGETAVSEAASGDVQIAVPIRAQPGGAGPKQIVGYAIVEYDPAAVTGNSMWIGLAASLFVVACVVAMLSFGAWWLVLRPIAALREETELAFLGDNHDVAPPVRLTQIEQLAHSINRLAARARSGGRR